MRKSDEVVCGGSTGWHRGLVTVPLQATNSDDASSTLLTTYDADGGAPGRASIAPLTFATDGPYALHYRSVENAPLTRTRRATRLDVGTRLLPCTSSS